MLPKFKWNKRSKEVHTLRRGSVVFYTVRFNASLARWEVVDHTVSGEPVIYRNKDLYVCKRMLDGAVELSSCYAASLMEPPKLGVWDFEQAAETVGKGVKDASE